MNLKNNVLHNIGRNKFLGKKIFYKGIPNNEGSTKNIKIIIKKNSLQPK